MHSHELTASFRLVKIVREIGLQDLFTSSERPDFVGVKRFDGLTTGKGVALVVLWMHAPLIIHPPRPAERCHDDGLSQSRAVAP